MTRIATCIAVCVWIELCSSAPCTAVPTEPAEPASGLVGHWKLQGDCRDSSSNGNHGSGRNVTFGPGPDNATRGAAPFNGRDSWIEVPNAVSLRLGNDDFSFSVWIKPETPMRGVFGDIVSKFDAVRRRGINFHIAGSSSGYTSMCDTRHVHFGIDDGHLGSWEDCGKPCESNSLITGLVVLDGQLYCGIADAREPQDAARVFRYAGGRNWIDCGRLGNDPNHLSVQSMTVHEGKLYAGTGIWDWTRAQRPGCREASGGAAPCVRLRGRHEVARPGPSGSDHACTVHGQLSGRAVRGT